MPAMQAQQHAPLAAGPPPLLYTKRLSSFLQSSLSPQIHSAIVTTLSGKLLAYASRHPVSTLRTQCTVAASIWAIQSATTPPSTAATSPSSASASRGRARARAAARDRSSSSASSADDDDDRDDSPGSNDTAGGRGGRQTGSALAAALPPSASAESVAVARAVRPASITVQLSGAVVVIRPLKSPLLFICIGPSGSTAGSGGGDAVPSAAQTGVAAAAPASVHVDGPTDGPGREGPSTSVGEQQSNTVPGHPAATSGTDGGSSNLAPQAPTSAAVVGSPSETTSVLSGTSAVPSTAATATSVGAAAAGLTRRHTEELARWLDERLDTLWVPDESAGSPLDAR